MAEVLQVWLSLSIFPWLSMSNFVVLLQGFNGTIFAYGQTGSGKSYTMFGPRDEARGEQSAAEKDEAAQHEGHGASDVSPHKEGRPGTREKVSVPQSTSKTRGIIPRATRDIFRMIEEDAATGNAYTVSCSFLEIYQERVVDLLNPSIHHKEGLRVR